MTLGDWLGSQARGFRENNSTEHLRMLDCYLRAYDARERDPDLAFAAFGEGRHIAEQLKEPWWVLFYENEQVEALLHFKRDYRNVLELAVQTVLEVRKPTNAQFPGRFSIWDSLVAAYLGIDAEGYAEPIQQALDYLEAEIPQEPDGSRYLLLARKRIFALERDQMKEAYEACMRELDLAATDNDHPRAIHFATFTYCSLCQIAAFVRGTAGVLAWEMLEQWAKTAEELARIKEHHCELSEALAWQAVAALETGGAERAGQCLQTATATMRRLKMPPKRGYYDALVAYHEKTGNLEGALAVRDEELATIAERGRLLYECRVRVSRAGLLSRLARLQQTDLDAARESARELRLPGRHLAEIDRLAAT